MPTLNFKGKNYVYAHHLTVPFRQLALDTQSSLPKAGESPSMDDNLIIHGDNLHGLKALLPRYAGKIKCIYIDPPYNTGNEGWCYNDNVNAPLMKAWLQTSATPVDKEDMERHDKWLCMMWPRLQLLRELLSDDGVIFVSIDDNEVHHLRMIMDEIFGEDNFTANIMWNSTKSVTNTALISVSHTHNLVYMKNKDYYIKNRYEFRLSETGDGFSNPDFDPRGPWKADPFQVGGWRPNQQYEIKNPKTGKIYRPNEGCSWKNDLHNFKKLFDDNRIIFGTHGDSGPQRKRFLSEATERGKVTKTWWDDVGTTTSGTMELKKLFRNVFFDNPKPVDLIKRMIELCTSKNDIILDSFAGSGTTAHATLALNHEDGGNRKFILVEMEDYANTITAERVRRVIKGVPEAKDDALKAGLGGSFTFCKLGDEFNIEKILNGEKLPSYAALASYVFYTATGKTLDGVIKSNHNYFIGGTELYDVYMIYKDDLAFLRSNESALNEEKLKIIANHNPNGKKQKIVFATAKYMSQDALKEHRVIYCNIPHAIHKIAGN